ncbi:two-component regulator propeller domain-containing protein [Aquimarina agarivorans]|uniref:two-component regulator propeller domain-containing protein n=1 Tax=Aquimarina agarivorans TaxID=980584 RepID=UPI000248E9AA|nr:two-component regulator propeller domain-containing protein [Aquimarina agarivorans]
MAYNSFKKIKSKVCTFGLLFFASIIWAQQNITFEHITSQQGLSQNDVNSICQDHNGFIWLATHDGLNKYDGYSFTTYRASAENKNSLATNLINELVVDNDGFIWTLNIDKGISRFDPETETAINFMNVPYDKTSIISNSAISLYADHQNRLWVMTIKGLDVLDINQLPDNNEFEHYFDIIKKPSGSTKFAYVTTVFQDSQEQIWVGTNVGLYKAFSNANGKLTFIDVTEQEGLAKGTSVQKIIADTHGAIIIATTSHLMYKKNNQSKFKVIDEGFYPNIVVDNENKLWTGSNNGLFCYKYDPNKKQFYNRKNFKNDIYNPKSINRNAIRDIFIDESNVVWIGTKGGGLNKVYPKENPFATVQKNLNKNSLSHNDVRSVFQDSNGFLWVGTEDGALNVSKKANENNFYNAFTHYEDLIDVFAIEEVEQPDGKYLFFGLERPPYLIRLKLKEGGYSAADFENINPNFNAVFSIIQTQDKSIWIGTYYTGLYRWVPQTDGSYVKSHFPQQPNGLSNHIIRSFLEDAKGNLWIGTADGLSMIPKAELSKENPRFMVFKHDVTDANSLSHNYVLALHETADGSIWVGTFGGGLNQFKSGSTINEGAFNHFSVKDGLANDIIKSIEEDDQGNLWIASNNGLTKFNPETKKIRSYNINDGLQGNEFLELASFKRKNGQLIFGGVDGFNVFYPSEIKDNYTLASPLFTKLILLNKEVGVGQEVHGRVLLKKTLNDSENLTLKYSENSFSIEFSSAHYVAPVKSKFQYKLEGFDKNWINTTAIKRYATYTNIPYGTYTFKLKASNNDGLWSQKAKSITIRITPPLWETTLAYIVYGLLGLGLLIAFRKYTIVRAEEKHQLQVNKMEKEKSEELQQMELEFFTNISHEFRTPLTLIKGPLDYLEKNETELNSEDRIKQYNLMNKNANYLLRLVNQLLDFRRLDREKLKLQFRKLNIVEFIEETTGPFLFMANKKKIDFKVVSTKKEIEVPFDPDALEKIMNNLLFNAFKFTPEGNSIRVEIHEGVQFQNPQIFDKSFDLSSYVIVQIKDTGTGIPPEKVTHIFERYYMERKKNVQGAGIGLSFTKSLVELHEGFINVQSEVGKGTTFSVLFPLELETLSGVEIEALEEELQNESLQSDLITDEPTLTGELKADLIKINKNEHTHQSKLPNLLLVEDNEDIRTFVRQGLEKSYDILEAADGEEGLEIAVNKLPSLIVSDIMMPNLDGLEMSRQLRVDQKTSHIPIILLTAKSSTETEREALKLGIEDFVRKPFDLEMLVLKINNIISKRESLRQIYKSTISLEPSEITVTSVDEKFMKRAMAIVEDHMMDTEFSVETLVAEMGMSRSNLYLKLKEITGLSSSEFIRSVRLKRAVQLIKKSDMSVKEVMYMTGFNTASYFSKCFKKQYGMVPSEYVKSHKKEKNTK